MAGNSEASVSFLKKWRPEGPWSLTAINPHDRSQINGDTFTSATEARKFIDLYNGERNIYFHVNPTLRPVRPKADKSDIQQLDWLHIDVDPDDPPEDMEASEFPDYYSEERERLLSGLTDRLPKGIPQPTCVIYSGGGYQAFWKLKEPLPVDGNLEQADEQESYNRRLAQVFGGDKCHNCDRIMRLPGTMNVPDAKKAAKGRVLTEAKLLFFEPKRVYGISEFKRAAKVQTKADFGSGGGDFKADVDLDGTPERINQVEELDAWDIGDRLKIIMAQGSHPEQPKQGDNSRSAWLFDFITNMLRKGVPDSVIYAIITDPGWGIAASVVELKAGAHRYALRQITRAKEFSVDPNLMKMNDKHAVIGNIGGKCRIIEEVEDDTLHRAKLTISSFEDLKNRYSHIKIKVGEDKEGNPVVKKLGHWWLDNSKRRQFDYMRFMPQGPEKAGVYNLWRGFAVEPVPGNCELFLDHCLYNVCRGNKVLYDYLIKWMAMAVQHPAQPGEVALVLRGGKGTGKGTVAKVFGRLFGRHFLQVANPSHLVGNFNAHLRDVLVLFADEAFFAGDKRHESVLKMLVTEETIPIEAKGIDVEPVPNYVHLIMAANDPHVIRASGDERRYFVLEMGEDQKQNAKFFGDMHEQLSNGGYEALLYHLQTVDLEGFQVRNVPQTDALQEQKMLSMSVEEEWFYRKLVTGRLLETDSEWQQTVATEMLVNDFIRYAERWRFMRRGNETSLGRFLKSVMPHIIKKQASITVDDIDEVGHPIRRKKRTMVYDFGALKQCREAWEERFGQIDWETQRELEPDERIEEPF